MDLNKLMETAEKAALAAGAVMRMYLERPNIVSEKGFRDVVTEADVKAQKVITDIIQKKFPTHGFLTEEDDKGLPSEGPIIWIIDPIDGTTNYSRGFPEFCTSIAAVENKQPASEENVLVGVIFDPSRNELFCASRDGKILLNNKPIQSSKISSIEDAIIGHDWNRDSDLRKNTLNIVSKLRPQANALRSLGSGSLALAWVAAGRFDGYFNYSLNTWDIAAASLMIKQAGGRVSAITGEPLDLSTNKLMHCLASNRQLYESLLSLIPERIVE